MYISIMMLICIKQYVLSNTSATFETEFMEKLSNTEAVLRDSSIFNKILIVHF